MRRRTRRMLQELERDLIAALRGNDPGEPIRTAFQRRRLEQLLQDARSMIRATYRRINQSTSTDLYGLAELEVAATREIVNAEVGANLMATGIRPERLIQLVDETFISGGATQAAPIREWWAQQAGGYQRRLANAVRQGMLRDETLQQLVRRVRGTRARNFQDGVAAIGRRDAETLIRTAVNGVTQQARLATFEANDDVIKGVAVAVTLDSRTSRICMSRSGGSWDLTTGDPLPDSATDIQFPGPLPWHFNERSRFVPVVKSYNELIQEELGPRAEARLADLSPAERAELDGMSPVPVTYEEWLARQPKARQQAILGPSRWELWDSGQIQLSDLTDQSGRELTVAELAAL